MNNYKSNQSDEFEPLVTILGSQRCRDVLAYFRESSTEVASVEELASELATQDDRARCAIDLHHSVLPRLSERGVLDYDARSTTVRYDGLPQVEDDLTRALTNASTDTLRCQGCGRPTAAQRDGETLIPAHEQCPSCESTQFEAVSTGETIQTEK